MRTYLILIFCLFLLVACGKDESPPPNPEAPQIRVSVSEALVFEIPTRESEVVFRLIEGDQTPILAQTPPDLLGVVWYQIVQGEEFGWVAGSQVTVSGNISQVRTVSDSIWDPTSTPIDISELLPTPTQTPLPTARPRIQTDAAPLLDTPNGAQIGELALDEPVDILGQTSLDITPSFYLVGQNQQVLGWVAVEDIHLGAELGDVPVIENVQESLSALLAANLELIASTTPFATATNDPSVTSAAPTATLAIPVTLIPSQTPNLVGTVQGAPTATDLPTSPTPTLGPNEAMIGIGVDPPFEFTLPEGWQAANLSIPLQSEYLTGNLPVSIYQGTLAEGIQGTIWAFWGFPNVTRPSGEINLYADGVQLLRGVLFDQSCNIGLGDSQFTYEIGGHEAIGTIYAAVDCADTADIAGFFGVLQLGNGANFAFFGGIEPPDMVNEWLPTLQNMLKTIVFENLEN